MARRVHGERSVGLLYGQRALLIGALEPLTYTGTMLSTAAGDHPFTRLARTAKIQETVFLVIKGTLPPRVREIFGIRWSVAHEASFQSVALAHRQARHAMPRPLRRGRNDYFFDLVTAREKERGGTSTPRLTSAA